MDSFSRLRRGVESAKPLSPQEPELQFQLDTHLPQDLGSATSTLNFRGLPWRSRGEDSAFPMQGARVRSLDGELRSHIPHGAA